MQLNLPDINEARTISLEPDGLMDDDRYFDFCQENPDLRIERTSEGKIIIMPPCGLESGNQEFNLGLELGKWAEKDGRGRAFGPSVGFILPSRAAYAPDASWVSYEQLRKLSKDEKAKFPHLVPEFVVEVRSPSDRLTAVKGKMREWMANGVQLACFIDGKNRKVTVYRPGREPEELVNPKIVVGDGPVKGFRLHMAKVWDGF